MMGLSHFLVDAEIEAVRSRDDNVPMHSLHEAYAVLLEEVDELWQQVKQKPRQRDAQAIYRELVQIAAAAACTAVELLAAEPPAACPICGTPGERMPDYDGSPYKWWCGGCNLPFHRPGEA